MQGDQETQSHIVLLLPRGGGNPCDELFGLSAKDSVGRNAQNDELFTVCFDHCLVEAVLLGNLCRKQLLERGAAMGWSSCVYKGEVVNAILLVGFVLRVGVPLDAKVGT